MLVQREVANNTRTYPTDKYRLNTQSAYTKSLIDLNLSNIYLTMSTKANSSEVYYLPDGGIPDTDMSAPVLTSLEKANTAKLDDNVFWATYGTTTRAEVVAAVTAGKIAACKYGNYVYYCSVINTASTTANIYFESVEGNLVRAVYVSGSNQWGGPMGPTLEQTGNKKTTITGNESSNTYYPTTKAVADYVNGIVGDISDILDEINGEVI